MGALGVVAAKAKGVEAKALVAKLKQKVHVGLSEPGGPRGNEPPSPQILADTLINPVRIRGPGYAQDITTAIPSTFIFLLLS